jgi:hypothetical protein
MQTSTVQATKRKPDTTLRCIYKGDLRHEILLMQWWQEIVVAGELEQTLCRSLHTPLAFCAHFSQPDLLRFCIDERGIWFAFWAEPLLAGGVQGLWARPTYRKSRVAVDCFLRALDWAFGLYPLLLSTTVQDKVARQLKYLGYTATYDIPGLWPGAEHCLVQYQTREHWNDWRIFIQKHTRRHGYGRSEGC